MKVDQARSRALLYALTFLFFSFLSAYTNAQEKGSLVKGIVQNNNGQSLAGVSVIIRNTSTNFTSGTSTDSSGVFTFSRIPSGGPYTFSFSIIGYDAQTLSGYNIKEGITLSLVVKMQEAGGTTLNQVVVVGYGTQRKADVTGSVATVSTKGLSSLPVPNVGEAIEGKAAGVQVISSGSPGSNVTFRVRGTGTINNSDPLLVIDGVPTDAPLNNINTDDIASIDILKDASATAIYGSRGANGVVLITTKKGSSGRGRLSFTAYTGVQNATHVVQMLNARQFAMFNNEMLANNNQATNPTYAKPDTLGTGTNWLNSLLKPAPIQSYSLSFSGGSERSTYYISASYLNQQGIVINTAYKRYNVQFNGEAKVLDWLKIGNNFTLNHDEKPSGAYDIRSAMAANPVQKIYNADGTYSGPTGLAMWYGDITNPIGKATVTQNNTLGYNVLGSIYAEATILKGLKFKTTGGVQANFWDSRTWAPKYNWQPIAQPNSFLSQQYNKAITLLWDNYFTYDKFIGADHHLTILAGTSAQNNRYNYMNGNISTFASDLTQQLNNGTTNINLGGNTSEWALFSLMSRVNYVYKDKYLLTGTVRRDGSSRFGTNNKYGTFPSASLAWRVSKEDFFKNINFINDLKVRVGYGVTGNQNIGNYSFAAALNTAQYNFNGQVVSAVFPLQIPNPGVKWETVEQSNIGFDASLLKNRINITFDAYLKNTTNMLVPAVVPISTGYSDQVVPFINAGKVRNSGTELTISTRNLTGKFTWNTDFNISYNQNKIISLNDTTPLHNGSIGLNYYLGINQTGHPVNEFYGYIMDGIFQSQSEVDKHALQQPGADPYNRTSAGDVKFRDLNNDGVINDKDRTFIGNPNPTFIFSLNNSFSYYGVDLSVFLQGVQGNKIFNANNIFQEGMNVAQNQTTATLGRWEGAGTSNTMPRAIFNDPNSNTRPSTRFIEDGSYLRIKNITLGYTFPKNIVQHIKFSSLRIYASCNNLYTFTRYTGFDPEVPYNGIDYSVYPVTRTVSVGINLNL